MLAFCFCCILAIQEGCMCSGGGVPDSEFAAGLGFCFPSCGQLQKTPSLLVRILGACRKRHTYASVHQVRSVDVQELCTAASLHA